METTSLMKTHGWDKVSKASGGVGERIVLDR